MKAIFLIYFKKSKKENYAYRAHLKRSERYAGLAVGCDNVDAEEGHPAHQEYAHDYADSDRGLVVGHVVRAGRLRLRLRLRWFATTALRTKTLGHRRVRQLRHRSDTLHVFLRVAIEPRKRNASYEIKIFYENIK